MIFSASIPISRLFLGVPIFILLLEEFLVASCLMLIRKDLGQPCTGRAQETNFHLSALRQAITGYIQGSSLHCFLFFTLSHFWQLRYKPARKTQKIIQRHQCSLISRYLLFKPHSLMERVDYHVFDVFNPFKAKCEHTNKQCTQLPHQLQDFGKLREQNKVNASD